MRFCHKKLGKHKVMFLDQFLKYGTVKIVQIKNSDLAFHLRDVLYDFIRLGFPQTKIILFASILLDQFHKCIDCKRIMLGGNTKLLFPPGFFLISFLQQCRLLQNLSGIS